jgi:hypothetical protein
VRLALTISASDHVGLVDADSIQICVVAVRPDAWSLIMFGWETRAGGRRSERMNVGGGAALAVDLAREREGCEREWITAERLHL